MPSFRSLDSYRRQSGAPLQTKAQGAGLEKMRAWANTPPPRSGNRSENKAAVFAMTCFLLGSNMFVGIYTPFHLSGTLRTLHAAKPGPRQSPKPQREHRHKKA